MFQVISLVRFIQVMLILSCLLVVSRLYARDVLQQKTSTENIKRLESVLLVPKQKTTVGVVPYYIKNSKIYVLLGRERIHHSQKADSGTYSDFGGNVLLNGSTIAQNAARELLEETMGQIDVHTDELSKNSKLLFKLTESGREVYYLFYKLSTEQFTKSLRFDVATKQLNASGLPNTYYEKDHFVWVNLHELVQSSKQIPVAEEVAYLTATTLDGTNISLKMRNYFLNDCLRNPEIENLLQKLQ